MHDIPLDARIYVAGHTGLVGSAVLRRLDREGFTSVLTATRDQLDLRDQAAVNYWFKANRPEYVFLVAGIKLCQAYRRQYGSNFISAMPTNLFGPEDNFDLQSSHVLPALIRKFHEAKLEGRDEVVVWGSGSPRREFLHVDDLADACLFLMRNFNDETQINVGTGEDLTIRELATMVGEVVHPDAQLVFDASKPDGMPFKLLNVKWLHRLGWKHSIDLPDGIRSTYAWYLENSAARTEN